MEREPGLTTEERAELERLRAVVAGLLIVVGCVLAPLSMMAVWTRNQVTGTDRCVAAVSLPWPGRGRDRRGRPVRAGRPVPGIHHRRRGQPVGRQRPRGAHEVLHRSGLAAAIGEARLYRSLADATPDLRAALGT